MTRLAEKTSAAARLWKCKRSTPPQRRASFKDIQTDSDVLCATASEHDWPLVESRGRWTSALCQSHRQRPAGSRHVTCTRRWCLCRLLHLATLLRGREGEGQRERERQTVMFCFRQRQNAVQRFDQRSIWTSHQQQSWWVKCKRGQNFFSNSCGWKLPPEKAVLYRLVKIKKYIKFLGAAWCSFCFHCQPLRASANKTENAVQC